MPNLVAKVEQGQVRGKTDHDFRGGEFISFLGIPYAKPPVGSLRFKDPQPPEPWTGIRDATKVGDQCYGKDLILTPEGIKVIKGGSEDCLILNIFTHGLINDVKELKPVMVYIHGGAFTMGSSNPDMYGPQFFMMEDIVLVTINYRIGALGFLSVENHGIGNAALKDMVQALKWIKNNIENFAGDPNNVTIFGESAGGASVHYLFLSPLAKGLFHKAIAQSGNALNPWAHGTKNNHVLLAKALGCTETNDETVLKFLEEQPVEKIYEGQEILKDHLNVSKLRYFCPTLEKPSPKAFLSDKPIKLIYSGNFNQVPFMTGCTTDEGFIVLMVDTLGMVFELENEVPHFLGLEIDSKAYKELNDQIIKHYFEQDSVDPKNIPAQIDMLTEGSFLRGTYTSVKVQAATSSAPVYFYNVTAYTDLNATKKLGMPGVAHGDDIAYLFKNLATPDLAPDSVEFKTIQKFLKLWTNFARTGNPTPKLDSVIDVEWKPVTEDSLNHLDIGTELKAGENLHEKKMKFWNEIYSKSPEGY